MNIPHIHTVSVGVFVKVGSRNECEANSGIAHFTEHLLFKGTERRSAFQIVKETDDLGANINAFTSKEMTAFYFQCLDDCVPQCADVLSDILMHSVFPDSEVEKERGVVLEEISMVADVPDDLSQELCAASFWGKNSLARSILGPQKNVRAFTSDDVRKFVAQNYVASNVVVSIVGNISREAAVELTQKYFDFPAGKAITKPEMPVTFGGKPMCSYKQDVEQANVTYAFPSFGLQQYESTLASLFSCAFGGGMSSRLFQSIREQLGLVYSIFSYPSSYSDCGALCIYFGTNPNNLGKAVEALAASVKRVCADGITAEEFARAKQQVKCALIMSEESSMSMMRAMGKYGAFFNELYSTDKQLADINAAKLDDVNALIPKIFNAGNIGCGYVGKKTDFNFTEAFN